MTETLYTLPTRGARFRILRSVERFPHFRVPAGATGTIVDADENVVSLHMDEFVPGAEPWDNELVWTVDDDYDEHGQPARTPRVAAAFGRATAPLGDDPIPRDAQTPKDARAQPFERDEHEGSRVAAVAGMTDADGEPSWFDVIHRGAPIGRVLFHEPTLGAPGLAGAAHWSARSLSGECVNRTASGVGLGATLETGERSREAAVALLVAWHIARPNGE
jgi:hypothetical protein